MWKKPLLFLIAQIVVIILGVTLSYFVSGKNSLKSIQTINAPNSENIKGETYVATDESDFLSQNQTYEVLVTRVIDGDTIEIEGSQRIRYIGIDSPETVNPNIKTQCFGTAAAGKNKELVEGKRVSLEKDVSETDKYGRLLRYVYLGDQLVNELLVREGYAHALSYPPDTKYQNQLNQAQEEAQQGSRGMWGSCSKQGIDTSEITQEGCNIKGNISSSGDKIYHLLGQKYWSKTVIDETRGEKYFCTEEEAQKAGFRKSKV